MKFKFFKLTKKFLIFSIAFTYLINPTIGFAFNYDYDEYGLYSEFIFSLSQNLNGMKNGKFCVFGNDQISKSILLSYNHVIEVSEDLKNIELCNIVYVASNKQKTFKFIGKKFIENKIVTIANYNGFSLDENSMIEIQLGRRNFELLVNRKNLKANNIRFSPIISNLVIN
ncbi:hypothetical protein LBMAG18_11870 [Alphaproteobacteria bacterium]|nr:hypothetical protein LBMAG18_11870 [Alphaproteobacteria bacterium]